MSLKSPLEFRSSIIYDTAASPVPLIAPNPKRISPLSPTTKLLSDLFMSGPKTLIFCFLHSSIKYETLSILF